MKITLKGIKTIGYRKSTYIQDPPMQKMKVLAQFYDALIKILLSKNSQKFGKFFGHFEGKKIFLQIDSKWSETRKKHETADPSAAAADRFSQ